MGRRKKNQLDPDAPVIRIRDLKKIYRMGVEEVRALDGVDLDIRRNEFVAIMGASGSGKSTLMNILGCRDKSSEGTFELNGRDTQKIGSSALSAVRNREIGFIFQTFELLPRASSLKNVMLPMLYSKSHLFSAKKRAKRALDRVGLGGRVGHRPNQLSGGQRQRVAVARALVNDPTILLADEPTGNLDTKTTDEIIDLFRQLHAEGQTIIVVTHEEDVAGHAERIVRLRDGRIVSDHPTDEDPTHRAWAKRAEEVAAERAKMAKKPQAQAGAEPTASSTAEPKGERSMTAGRTAEQAGVPA